MSIFAGWDPPGPGWTCGECGFVYDATDLATIADSIKALGRRYRPPLTRGLPGEDLDVIVRQRPQPTTWSALEYACHVRDALALYDWRIGKTLTEDRPEFPPMRRDEVALERGYNAQDRLTVSDELALAAERLAQRIADVGGDEWTRVCVRDGQELDVVWMSRNSLHEGNHHLLDIGRVLRQVRSTGPKDTNG